MNMKELPAFGMVGLFASAAELATGDHHLVAFAAELFGWTEARRDGPMWFEHFYGHRILYRPLVIAMGDTNGGSAA